MGEAGIARLWPVRWERSLPRNVPAGDHFREKPVPVRCEWSGDDTLGQRYCDREDDTGSASGSGYEFGQLLGKLMFGGDR
ncbi:hypothetical protein [Nocardia asteroides]|uniref:hypothetical protein n=1 Tax=Nocardia asteroides TaxID=1824 RepID=UPI001E5195F6|nr:hypothetical protein [Nocardia asteroides]UGT61016.1 hypothetical protein LTT61_28390 [Nocardia asteroides]